jgi:hypothetical protein
MESWHHLCTGTSTTRSDWQFFRDYAMGKQTVSDHKLCKEQYPHTFILSNKEKQVPKMTSTLRKEVNNQSELGNSSHSSREGSQRSTPKSTNAVRQLPRGRRPSKSNLPTNSAMSLCCRRVLKGKTPSRFNLSSAHRLTIPSGLSVESFLTRELGISFIDARMLTIEARVKLGQHGYGSREQDQQVVDEAKKMFAAKPMQAQGKMQKANASLDAFAKMEIPAMICHDSDDTTVTTSASVRSSIHSRKKSRNKGNATVHSKLAWLLDC